MTPPKTATGKQARKPVKVKAKLTERQALALIKKGTKRLEQIRNERTKK